MDNKFSQNLTLLTQANLKPKVQQYAKVQFISRLILGCCYMFVFTGSTINVAKSEGTQDTHSQSYNTQPPRARCTGDLQVECFYVDIYGTTLYQSGQTITVPGYRISGSASCWPKPDTYKTMDKACAALGPVNNYPLFASTWWGGRVPENGCAVGYQYDSNNKVCVQQKKSQSKNNPKEKNPDKRRF